MTLEARLDIDGLIAFLGREFPKALEEFTVVASGAGTATLSLKVRPDHLRPGGTVSGPTMFALADVAFYAAALTVVGPEPLTVTTNAAIDFMRRPPAGADLRAEARVLKLGRTLVVGDVMVLSGALDAPVARASMTYARPPRLG